MNSGGIYAAAVFFREIPWNTAISYLFIHFLNDF